MENEHQIWTEKYRPKTFADVKGQDEIVNRVRAFVEQKNMPHLLFAGPAGVGKTTLSLVVAKTLFSDAWSQNFLELNASNERGIDVVRVKVKDFARTRTIGDVPFKIIYLDECDALTKDAQHALRRTMESYTGTCRFILSCNYSSKIIDPIQSRCTIFRFKPLPKENVFEIIEKISSSEDLKVDQKAKEALYLISEGDCRRVENLMQACSALDKKITEEIVFSLAAVAKPGQLKEVLELALKNKFVESRKRLLDIMLEYGLSGLDVIKQIQSEIWNLSIDPRKKMMLIDKCAEIEFRLVEGSDEFIQLEALLAQIGLAGI